MIQGKYYVRISNPIGKCNVVGNDIHGKSMFFICNRWFPYWWWIWIFFYILNMDVSGSRSNISHWTILYYALMKSIVQILLNWYGDGILPIYEGMGDPLTAQYMTIFLIYGWEWLLWLQMWLFLMTQVENLTKYLCVD